MTIPFLMFLGAVKWKGDAQQSNEWKPSRADVLKMRGELIKFQPIMVNGRKQYPLEQYLVDQKICSVGDNGFLQVIYPLGYYQANQIYALHEWIQEKDQEALFQAYPEEREIHEAKVKKMFSDIKDMLKNKKVDIITTVAQ